MGENRTKKSKRWKIKKGKELEIGKKDMRERKRQKMERERKRHNEMIKRRKVKRRYLRVEKEKG